MPTPIIAFYFGHTISMKNRYEPNLKDLSQQKQISVRDLISLIMFYFFVASTAGFLWEVLIFLVKEGQFRNRGFLYGPWLPVYGTGAVLMYVLLFRFKKKPLLAFLFSLIIGSTLELIIGWLLDHLWELRYWDYTDSILNFRGYVCLASALGFGVAGVLWICLLSGLLEKLWFKIPVKVRYAVNTLTVLLFILDCAAALIFPNTGRGITFP